ncbi:transposase, partial [Colletotrichum incanum]
MPHPPTYPFSSNHHNNHYLSPNNQYSEFKLHRALEDVAAGCHIRQAARNWGIPYLTLRHRLYGTQSRDTAWADYQQLSQAQESSLAAYISTQSALGSALTYQQVKGLAEHNGWTTNQTALEWLEKVFIPYTQPAQPDEARLLILDAHQSHTTIDFMWQCFQNNIYLLYLPPHSSTVLQPLDVSVFGLLKQAYRKGVRSIDDW